VWPSETVRLAVAFGSSVVLALGLTPIARSIARRVGLVAPPREDRWHREPTALLGGPPIVLAALATFAALGGLRSHRLLVAWAGGALLIAILGFLDDLFRLRPASKLIGQIVAALVPISLGLAIPVFHPILSFWITLVWIVGIANAFNLIDNMDGLAGGIAAIAAGFLSFHSLQAGNYSLAVAALCVAGAAIGFLVYNFKPASIFMGDGGSLFLGYSLATLSLIDLGSRPLVSFSIVAVPLFVLAIPIFDTTLVTFLRLANRRSIAQGGRDHSSHRLVSLGLSERRAVLTLWGLAAATGCVSLLLPRLRASLVVLIVLLATLAVYYFGSYLGSVNVYRSDAVSLEQARRRGLFILDTFIAHKQRILDVAVDLVIVAVSYLAAYLLRYEGSIDGVNMGLILRSLPFLVACRLLSFFVVGLYRTVPGAFSLHDFLAIVKAVFVSSAVFVAGLVLVTRFTGYSRAVMVTDAVLTLAGTTAARLALRSIREVMHGFSNGNGRRVLIAGAGNLGEAAVRLLRTDTSQAYRIVGFLDDSRDKIGRRLHGLPVLAPISHLERVVREESVETLVIASSKLEKTVRARLKEFCERGGIEVREIHLSAERDVG
jgi:UDP-GlcNAc:undecaprenyl-phosphate GlcNAc-1-phosphate transferase